MSSIARRIATMGASDADVRLWIAAVIANGGSVSKARASIIDRFVAAENNMQRRIAAKIQNAIFEGAVLFKRQRREAHRRRHGLAPF